jgi:hypothetical protein
MVDRGLPAWRSVRLRTAAESDFIVRTGQVYLPCPTTPHVAACRRVKHAAKEPAALFHTLALPMCATQYLAPYREMIGSQRA